MVSAFRPSRRTFALLVGFACSLTACQAGTSLGPGGVSAVVSSGTAATPTPKAVATATSPGASAQPSATPSPQPTSLSAVSSKWVSAWADAPTGAEPGPLDNMTVREILKPTVGSRGTIRLHFSNYFGTSAITLGSVHLGTQIKGAAVSGDVPVTFSGAKSVSIPAGGFVTSDAVPFSYSYGVILAVTEYVEGVNPLVTFHEQGIGKVTSYQTAQLAGDATADSAGTSFTGTTLNTYLLDRLDVFGNYKETIVAFGSSTTDGYQDNGTGLDQHKSWPEQLAEILHANGRDDIGIANAGIAGNTAAYPLGTGPAVPAPNPVYGEPGFLRFDRDVLAIPGAGLLIEYLGADDLRNYCDPLASELVPYKADFVARAHAAGLRVLEATTAPSAYCEEQSPAGFGTRFPQGIGEEAQRFAIVAWEKSAVPTMVDGTLEEPSGADGVIDFSGALTDPSNLSYMLPKYDSGDDVHPNTLGYSVMANAIPLSEL